VILGRELELERLGSLLSQTLTGEGGTLVIIGDPGMGKTTLLEWVRAQVGGGTVLSAGGRESESDLPFVALTDLLRPLEGRLASLPAPQGRALRTALALSDAAAGDRLAVNVAALRLLGDHAADEPLLILIDDYQWLDTATRGVVDFLARRSATVGVGVVIGSRGLQPSEHGGEVLHLGPLSESAASALVNQIAHLTSQSARSVIALAAGNPLALMELPRILERGDWDADVGSPISVTASLQRAFGSHLERLSDRCQLALLCVVEAATPELATVAPAWGSLGLTLDDLTEALAAGLLIKEADSISFRHPLVRSVARYRAHPADLRRANQALADTATDSDRRAWHLAAAVAGRDEEAASALDDVAQRALIRGASSTAAAAFRRAASLSEDKPSRLQRLSAAARAAHRAGNLDLTASLIGEARTETDQGPDSTLLVLEADIRMRSGDAAGAYATLRLEAGRIAHSSPHRAATMLLLASKFRVYRLEAVEALSEVEQALALVSPADREVVHYTALAMAQTMAGHPDARANVRRAAKAALSSPHGHIHSLGIGWPLVWLEEYELAHAFIKRSVDIQREGGFLAYLPQALLPLAELEFRTGHWDDARLHATEALGLSEDLRQPTEASFASSLLARIEAGFGDEISSRAHARSALDSEIRLGFRSATANAKAALGFLEVGLGNYQAAAAVLEESHSLCEVGGTTEPWLFPVDGDLVEALVRLGEKGQALLIAKSLTARGEAVGRKSAMAVGQRAIGLASEDEDFRDPFETALAIHADLPTPFEVARTELAYGERLRRAKKRDDARRQLRRALEVFEGLGAGPWTERTRLELELSGETLATPRSVSTLTRQERQVATIVARGVTNREAAATLFVNHKTIEYHLGNVYRKLGVRSRTELANVMRDHASPWEDRFEDGSVPGLLRDRLTE